jgi:hypothetical protein
MKAETNSVILQQHCTCAAAIDDVARNSIPQHCAQRWANHNSGMMRMLYDDGTGCHW